MARYTSEGPMLHIHRALTQWPRRSGPNGIAFIAWALSDAAGFDSDALLNEKVAPERGPLAGGLK